MDLRALVRDESGDILRFLEGLTAEQWETPSLCAGWRVRDVAAHLLVQQAVREYGLLGTLSVAVRNGFSVHRLNAIWIKHCANWSTDRVVDAFRRSFGAEPGGVVWKLLGPESAVRATVIHHQDMRRPLGLLRVIPEERLITTLDVVLTTRGSANLGSHERAQGLRLRATDVAWSRGDGPEVVGPGEALLMALAGRSVALEELTGEGKALLSHRMQPVTAMGPARIIRTLAMR